MSTRKIDGRKAEITNKMKEYTTYRAFAVKHGYPDAAVVIDSDDPRKPLQNGDVVTLLTSGTHESDDRYTIWVVEAANGERHLIREDGLRILNEDHALNDEITVLPDESLGGVLREYREVKRKAHAGEWIKITNNVAGHLLPIGHVCKAKNADYAEGWSLCHVDDVGDAEEPDYVVLEPTDIVYVDNKRFRMVDRKAAVGDRVIIVNEGSESFGGRYYRIGNVGTVVVDATTRKNIHVDFSENDEYLGNGRWNVSPGDYRVLEQVEVESALLSTQPATDQIAENIANLTAKVTELETRLNALYDWHKRAAVDIRVAHEDIFLVEEGAADAIKSLESRVSALEYVKVASGPVDKTPPSFITLKTPQQIRDEIVERAKDDVKALLNTPDYGIEALDGAYISYIPHIHRVKFVINRDKRTIVALVQDGRTDKLRLRGIAKCAPNDVFNAHIGRAIALRRAFGLVIPAKYLNAPNPTEVRVGDVVDYGGRIATVALDGRSIDTRTHTFISTAVECDATIIDDSRESEKGVAA